MLGPCLVGRCGGGGGGLEVILWGKWDFFLFIREIYFNQYSNPYYIEEKGEFIE